MNHDEGEAVSPCVIPLPTNWQPIEKANILQKNLECYDNINKALFNCIDKLNDLLKKDKQKVYKKSK